MKSELRPPPFSGGLAVVLGASGGIGQALCGQLQQTRGKALVLGLSRSDMPVFDYASEESVAAAAQRVGQRCEQEASPLRLLIIATGFLHGSQGAQLPEKSWRDLDSHYLQTSFAINAIGPALAIKHFFPLLAADGDCRAVALSAKVGSIGDNRLGGWYAYRASKAALNQLMHTAAIELTRRNRQSICVTMHPGTVDTPLSAPFAKTGLRVRSPEVAAAEILASLATLTPAQTGGFFDYRGQVLPW